MTWIILRFRQVQDIPTNPFRDRLAVGRLVLAQVTEVRILVPEPRKRSVKTERFDNSKAKYTPRKDEKPALSALAKGILVPEPRKNHPPRRMVFTWLVDDRRSSIRGRLVVNTGVVHVAQPNEASPDCKSIHMT
jgi:hypothetical protein